MGAKYLSAKDLTLIEKLKEISKLHFRGYSNRVISEKLQITPETVARHIRLIENRTAELENFDRFLSDTIMRTMDQVKQLDELTTEAWEELERCKELIPQRTAVGQLIFATDDFGEVLTDPETGKERVTLGPRSPGRIPTLIAQIQSLGKQKAEILRLLSPKIDISVKLQIQERTQSRILEVMQELSPEIYEQLYRELQVIAESAKSEGAKMLQPGIPDAIDAEFEEVAASGESA